MGPKLELMTRDLMSRDLAPDRQRGQILVVTQIRDRFNHYINFVGGKAEYEDNLKLWWYQVLYYL